MSEQQVVRTAGIAALRGALLVGAAVLIGVLLLSKGDGFMASGSESDDGAGTTTEATVATNTTLVPEVTTPQVTETTTAAPELRPVEDVATRVENGAFTESGNRVAGAAGSASDRLRAEGYQVNPPGNWPEAQPQTVVYFKNGFQPEARALADVLSIPQAQVEANPGNLPGDRGMGGADVLVVLGADIAE
jgi:hypothetical protein